jgi:hypothetical protein
MKSIIVDLDGICFDADERIKRHTHPDGTIDWDGAYKNTEIENDPIIPGAPEATQQIAERYEIVYITGRSEICRLGTLSALRKHDFTEGLLCMRGRFDIRSGAIVKREWINKLPNDFMAAVDDDKKLREMYLDCELIHFFGFEELFEYLDSLSRTERGQ